MFTFLSLQHASACAWTNIRLRCLLLVWLPFWRSWSWHLGLHNPSRRSCQLHPSHNRSLPIATEPFGLVAAVAGIGSFGSLLWLIWLFGWMRWRTRCVLRFVIGNFVNEGMPRLLLLFLLVLLGVVPKQKTGLGHEWNFPRARLTSLTMESLKRSTCSRLTENDQHALVSTSRT